MCDRYRMLKKTLVFFGILSLALMGCEESELTENPSLDELEKFIRKTQDSRTTHTFAQYERILEELTDDKYVVLPINEFRDSVNNSRVLVGMRHDVDCHPFKALTMARLEKEHHIRSTYYILATGKYYGRFTPESISRYKSMEVVYEDLHDLGHEIGIHNDLLTIRLKHHMDPFLFNQNELDFYNDLGIEVYGTAAHGSAIASKTVPNFQIFSDFAKQSFIEYQGNKYEIGKHSLKEYGFDYEAYFADYNRYYSESGGTWSVEGGFNSFLNKLEKSEAGDRIQILTHPVWWGK